ncbi:unnamed protein product [Nippostrongylus brasiliensis]|uniref:RRM domain-containing protein n=1 Tax=Nippostrongylus brasiliensis TaxID=27835 RepID=A0A0N4YSZ1_NIPBR|nr:unnamed protein product [Nippostrongylus brasiliensis]
MELLSSPSYHHISPITRSRSDVRSSAMKSPSTTRFARPSYGYGGGYMARSLSRSGSSLFGRSLAATALTRTPPLHNVGVQRRSSLFGRSLAATALTRTPPLHNVGVQRSTPHFTDKYPYVRYSYGNTDTSLGIATQSESVYGRHGGIRDIGTKRWLEGKLTSYNPSQFQRTDYRSTYERPTLPQRNYIRYMPVDDAVDMYKKRCMTVGTLSKVTIVDFTPPLHNRLRKISVVFRSCLELYLVDDSND